MGIIIYYLNGEYETFRNIARIDKNPFMNRIVLTFNNGKKRIIYTSIVENIELYV